MAISENLLTNEGLERLYSMGRPWFNNLSLQLVQSEGTSTLIDAVIHKIEKLHDLMSKNQILVFKRLGVSSEEELQKRVNDFYNSSDYTQFSGPALQKILDGYTFGTDKELTRFNNLLVHYYNTQVPQYIKDNIKNNVNGLKDKYIALAFNYINRALSFGSANITSKTVTKSRKFAVIDENAIIKATAQSLTSLQRDRLTKRVEELSEKEQILISDVELEIDDNLIQLGYKWARTTHGLKGADVKMSIETIKEKNIEIINMLFTYITVPNAEAFKQILINKINNNPNNLKAFFVGKATTQITGLLGEIAAYNAIIHLLGDSYTNEALDWVANHKVDKKSLSIDIVLKDIAGFPVGIQVKNTTHLREEIENNPISFAKGEADIIFQRLGIQQDPNNTLTSLIASNTFNVPFAMVGNKFKQVSSDKKFSNDPGEREEFQNFLDIHSLIEQLTQEIFDFLKAYAPDFLYAGDNNFRSALATLETNIDNSLSEFNGNYIYIVGGQVFLITSLLQRLYNNLLLLKNIQDLNKRQELKIKETFTFQSYVRNGSKDSSGVTIVDYRNGSTKELSNLSSFLVSSFAFN